VDIIIPYYPDDWTSYSAYQDYVANNKPITVTPNLNAPWTPVSVNYAPVVPEPPTPTPSASNTIVEKAKDIIADIPSVVSTYAPQILDDVDSRINEILNTGLDLGRPLDLPVSQVLPETRLLKDTSAGGFTKWAIGAIGDLLSNAPGFNLINTAKDVVSSIGKPEKLTDTALVKFADNAMGYTIPGSKFSIPGTSIGWDLWKSILSPLDNTKVGNIASDAIVTAEEAAPVVAAIQPGAIPTISGIVKSAAATYGAWWLRNQTKQQTNAQQEAGDWTKQYSIDETRAADIAQEALDLARAQDAANKTAAAAAAKADTTTTTTPKASLVTTNPKSSYNDPNFENVTPAKPNPQPANVTPDDNTAPTPTPTPSPPTPSSTSTSQSVTLDDLKSIIGKLTNDNAVLQGQSTTLLDLIKTGALTKSANDALRIITDAVTKVTGSSNAVSKTSILDAIKFAMGGGASFASSKKKKMNAVSGAKKITQAKGLTARAKASTASGDINQNTGGNKKKHHAKKQSSNRMGGKSR
jgi:hypothetical protein